MEPDQSQECPPLTSCGHCGSGKLQLRDVDGHPVCHRCGWVDYGRTDGRGIEAQALVDYAVFSGNDGDGLTMPALRLELRDAQRWPHIRIRCPWDSEWMEATKAKTGARTRRFHCAADHRIKVWRANDGQLRWT